MVDPLRVLAEARGHLFVFAPVAMAAGIGVWLGLEKEPGLWLHLGAALAALAGAAGLARGPEPMRVPAAAILCAAVGVLACALRAERVEAPVLGFRYYGPVEGVVVGV
ncbi:MAG: hypothetical protein RL123_2078, partial [Pseudomonadota bacterium]